MVNPLIFGPILAAAGRAYVGGIQSRFSRVQSELGSLISESKGRNARITSGLGNIPGTSAPPRPRRRR